VYVDNNGINVPVVGDLPLACAATLSASVNVQRMSVYAAVSGDVTLLKQAVLHDPLTAAVCDPEEIWQMVDEMLVAQAKWLPQYKKEIPAARKRLADARRRGTYRGTKTSKGAARKAIRTVKQLRGGGAKAKQILQADKAN
jgi:alpha-galactosidase